MRLNANPEFYIDCEYDSTFTLDCFNFPKK